VRVVSIKRPPQVIEDDGGDNFHVGDVYEVSPNLAIFLIAAGWVRGETRMQPRRQMGNGKLARDRRQLSDRRLVEPGAF
jgi:hypothetical protein